MGHEVLSPLLIRVGILAVAGFILACKSQQGQSALSAQAKVIEVGDLVYVTFPAQDDVKCFVIVEDVGRDCQNLAGNIYGAGLGNLDRDRPHLIEILVWDKEQTRDDASRHTLNYSPDAKRKIHRDYRFKLNIPLRVAEMFRARVSETAQRQPQSGCKMGSYEENIAANAEEELGLSRLSTAGFGEASASSHARNDKYARLEYSSYRDDQSWGFHYAAGEDEAYVTFSRPPTLQSATMRSHDEPRLSADLAGASPAGKVRGDDKVAVEWQVNDPVPEMSVTVAVVSDDAKARGECEANPKAGKMTLDESFLRGLPAGKYRVLIQLASLQRAVVIGREHTSWRVRAFDWKHGAFEKI